MKLAQFILLSAMLIAALAMSVLLMKGILMLIGAKATLPVAFGALTVTDLGIIGLLGRRAQ